MPRMFETLEEVEAEIARLKDNEYVRLARREKAVREKRRQCMYMLRMYEKKGKALAAAGVTFESLNRLDTEDGEI